MVVVVGGGGGGVKSFLCQTQPLLDLVLMSWGCDNYIQTGFD